MGEQQDTNFFDFRLKPPLSHAIFGSSMSGKTTHIKKMVEMRRELFSKPIGRIYYFFRSWQPAFTELERDHNVTFIQGIVTMEWLEQEIGMPEEGEERAEFPMVIVDDAGQDISSDTVNVFTVGTHHFQIVLVFLLHLLFSNSPHLRAISQNLSYFQLHKNPRNMQMVAALAKQVDPGQHGNRFVNIFKEATSKPYSYLFADMTQACPEDLRLRSNILFENGEPMVIYKRMST